VRFVGEINGAYCNLTC